MNSVRWREVEPRRRLGRGVPCARGDDNTLATALVVDGTLVHLSLSMAI